MESIQVNELMIPLKEYATVSEDVTLFEAVQALKAAQEKMGSTRYSHQAILVYSAKGRIVGKLSQFDVLKALEPKFQDVGDFKELNGYNINADYIRNLINELGLLQKPLDNICRKASLLKVKDIMYRPSADEHVDESATLNEAVIQLLMGKHRSLLVTRGKEITGILRLTDIFTRVADIIGTCKI